jgi:hypothetical protein
MHLIKIAEKNEMKLKNTWKLNMIKAIKLCANDKFEFSFFDSDRVEELTCESHEECSQFLTNLWKLSDQYLLPNEKPKFLNIQKPESLMSCRLLFEIQVRLHSILNFRVCLFIARDLANVSASYLANMTDEKIDETEESVEVPHMSFSKTDESSLLKLMTESGYASAVTDEFVKKLQLELTNLETVCNRLQAIVT